MEYKKCLVELDEILNYLNDEELMKIPEDIRNAITTKKDKNYTWKYDESKELREQNINRKTIAMLSYLNMQYLLNEEQRLLMEKLHRFNEEKAEKEKIKKYNKENIFNNNENNENKENDKINSENKVDNEEISETQMVIIKEEVWYKKIIKVLANIFSKKN